MKHEITSRMSFIIDTLIRKNQISLNEMCQNIGTSARKIRYDIVKINEIIGNLSDGAIIDTDHKGMILVNNKDLLIEFYEKQEKMFKFSKEQRTNLFSLIISFHIEKLNLNHLSQQLRVTRATIKNDLKSVEDELRSYNLKLQYSQAFLLVGKEEDIFEYRIQSLRKLEYSLFKECKEEIELLMREYILETFSVQSLRCIFPIINNFTKNNNTYLNDTELYWLASILLTLIWYIHNKKEIPKEKYFDVRIQDFTYDRLFSDLSKFTHFSINADNKEIIMKAISSLSYTEKQEVVNFEVVKYIVELIGDMEDKFCKLFKNDLYFLNGLYKHISSYYKKEVLGIKLPFSEKYKYLLDDDLEEYIEKYVYEHNDIIEIANESELYLLKLHFANCMQRNKVNITKKVLLVSGTSKLHSKSLKKSLETFFEIKVADVISRYDIPFFTNWEGIDLILFTETIPEYFAKQIPMLRINLILDTTDFTTLYSVGVLPKKKEFDFIRLYKDIDFLCKEDQKHVFQCIQNIIHSDTFLNEKEDMRFTVKEGIISNFHLAKIQYLGISLYFALGEENTIVFQKEENNIHLEIKATDVAVLCSSLIKLYLIKDNIDIHNETMLEMLMNMGG